MTFRTLCARAFLLSLLAVAGLAVAPQAAGAQPLAPLLLADCEAAPAPFPATDCDPQPQLDPNYQLAVAGKNLGPASAVTASPDGTRVFVGFGNVIEVYQRNVTTGELTYESCIEDQSVAPGSGAPLKLPLPCQVAPYLSIDMAPNTLTVSPDGNTLYVATSRNLVALSVGPTLAFVNCWASAEQAAYPQQGYACQPISAGPGAGGMRWISVYSPVVSPDGLHAYAIVNAPDNAAYPSTNYRAAVLHFSRNASTGDLTYADCAGAVLGWATAPFPTNAVETPVTCAADGGAFDLRGGSRAAWVAHPTSTPTPTVSLIVAGTGATTLGDADAVARLTVSASGSLAFAQCLRASGNPCVAGAGPGPGTLPSIMAVTADQRDAYVNSNPPVHLRFASDGTMTRQADLAPEFWFQRPYVLGPGDRALFGFFGTQIRVFDRNASTGAMTYRGCATSDPLSDPNCDFSLPNTGTYWGAQLAAPSGDGGVVTAAGSAWAVSSFIKGYVLTVTPGANGTASSSPGRITCGTRCQDTFAAGTTVSLSATAASTDFVFDAFGGDCAGSASPCALTMDADKSVSVSFAPRRFTLTFTGSTGGTVTSSPAGLDCGTTCTAAFDINTTVVLHATPAPGYVFGAWTGYCAGVVTDCVMLMNQDRAAGASFVPVYTLTTSVVGSGQVATSGSAGILCPGDCSEVYPDGTLVTLVATPSAGWTFTAWSGACSGSSSCQVTMSQAQSVTATFASALPAAPTGFNAIVTATKVGKKTVYAGSLTWTDASSNETGFLVQRYRTAKGKCSLDTGFATVTLAANASSYSDATATSATCGYQVAAQNGNGQSAWVRDLNVGTGVTP